jgi:hypothetical protein
VVSPWTDCIPFAAAYIMYNDMAALSVPVKDELNMNNAELGLIFASYSFVGDIVQRVGTQLDPSVFWIAFAAELHHAVSRGHSGFT